MCENNDPYRPWLWVGLVDQYSFSDLLLCVSHCIYISIVFVYSYNANKTIASNRKYEKQVYSWWHTFHIVQLSLKSPNITSACLWEWVNIFVKVFIHLFWLCFKLSGLLVDDKEILNWAAIFSSFDDSSEKSVSQNHILFHKGKC